MLCFGRIYLSEEAYSSKNENFNTLLLGFIASSCFLGRVKNNVPIPLNLIQNLKNDLGTKRRSQLNQPRVSSVRTLVETVYLNCQLLKLHLSSAISCFRGF